MKRIAASILITVTLLTLLSGCRDKMDQEDLRIPRLMVETRGVSYGGLIGETAVLPVTGTKIIVQKEPVVTEFEIVNVEMVKVELGLALMIELTEKGARDLYRASVTNKGGRVVLTVNGNAIGAQRFQQAVTDGKWYTFVEVDNEELGQLVLDMKDTLFEIHSSR